MDLEILKKRLLRYLEAEDAILAGQSYTIEGLTLTRADLYNVQRTIASLDAAITAEESRLAGRVRSRVRYVVPRDGVNMWRARHLLS